jgi:hypothetical protein
MLGLGIGYWAVFMSTAAESIWYLILRSTVSNIQLQTLLRGAVPLGINILYTDGFKKQVLDCQRLAAILSYL